MMVAVEKFGDDETLTIHIPLRVRKRGGRKLMLVPDGTTAWTPQKTRVDYATVKAIARAHRWRRLLERSDYASITDLAGAENINQSYACRILRLTLLAPSIVEAILEGQQPCGINLTTLMKPFPADWQKQCHVFASIT